MLTYYFYFVAACILLTLANPRMGLWLMLVAGLLADPLRKVTPGNPVYISIAFIIILGVVYLRYVAGNPKRERISKYIPSLKPGFQALSFFFIINAVRPLFVNIYLLPVILYGSAQYIGLLASALLGFNIIKDEKNIIKFADVFVITLLPFLFMVLLEFRGVNSEFFGVMAFQDRPWLLYSVPGMALKMFCGTFRSPELMGWYAMVAAVSSLYLLARKKKSLLSAFYYIGSFILSSSCVLLSGRRKFFLGIFMYILVFIILSARKSQKRALAYLIIFSVVCALTLHFAKRTDEAALYLQVGKTGFASTEGRFKGGVIGSIYWAIRRDGFFGRGLGASSQGSEHFKATLVGGGSIEAGPGKIISELGVPGFIALIVVVFAYVSGVYKKFVRHRISDAWEITVVFLLSLVLTHMAQFTISHQVYGDPLIAVLTGLTAGFLLAASRLSTVPKHKGLA